MDNVMSTKQVAELYGVDGGTVRGWARKGLLPSYKTPGGQIRFRKVDVMRDMVALGIMEEARYVDGRIVWNMKEVK